MGDRGQGDQIGRIFTHWVMVYFGQFFQENLHQYVVKNILVYVELHFN
jgi:hypothetical protein